MEQASKIKADPITLLQGSSGPRSPVDSLNSYSGERLFISYFSWPFQTPKLPPIQSQTFHTFAHGSQVYRVFRDSRLLFVLPGKQILQLSLHASVKAGPSSAILSSQLTVNRIHPSIHSFAIVTVTLTLHTCTRTPSSSSTSSYTYVKLRRHSLYSCFGFPWSSLNQCLSYISLHL